MSVVITKSLSETADLLAGDPGPVVMVPVYNSPDDVQACLQSLLRHTAVEHTLLFIDDASPDPTAVASVLALDEAIAHRVILYRHQQNLGFVRTCNEAFAMCAGKDIVLVNSDVVVTDRWLERMLAAAASSNTVATVSTLTNHGSILSVPVRNQPGPLPEGVGIDEAASLIAKVAKRTFPVIPTGVGHCLLVTRLALEVLGGFDTIFDPGYGEEVDFCQRAASRGLINILADDVFVFHRGGSSFGKTPEARKTQDDHERIIKARYPNYTKSVQWAATSNRSALAAALATARRAVVGIRVAVDGLCLGEQLMGTQRFVLETAIALSNQDGVSETHLFVPVDIPDYVLNATRDQPRLTLHPVRGYVLETDHFDAVVRPCQVDHPTHLRWMRHLADVAVVTQLDLIAYHNPAYFNSSEAWKAYREVTETTFDTVDGFAFISEHSLNEAVREGLLSMHHQRAVTYCGVDHTHALAVGSTPIAQSELRDGFLLVLGANYLHKNRPFALELWGLARERGFTGQLVLAGVTPPYGNTLADEAAWLAQHSDIAHDVVYVGSSSESEKAWLLEHSRLVLYPTLTEGFGMVPFEAALAGSPVLTTRQGGLDEVLPHALACAPSLVPADSLELLESLLFDEAFRAEQLGLLLAECERFTWASSAAALAELIGRALDAPLGRRSLGLSSQPLRSHARAVDGAVSRFNAHPTVHRLLVGSGTRRQKYLRRTANWIRRFRHRSEY